MSELGELLELMYGARGRWRTAQFVVRDWTETAGSQEAHDRVMERQGGGGGSVGQYMVGFGSLGAPALPDEMVMTSRVWVEGRKYRAETEQQGHASVTVSDGERIWHWSPGTGALVHDAGNSSSGWEAILDPRGTLAVGDLESVGRREVIGRTALVVHGRLDDGEPLRPFDGIPFGATDFELLVDAERGVVLRAEARLDGRPFQVREVLEITFDEPLPEETFVYEPPPGEAVRTHEEAFRIEHITLDEAARQATFGLWVPPELAEGWRIHVIYVPAREQPPMPETVNIVCHHERGAHQFQLQEAAAGESVDLEGFERIERDGVEVGVFVPENRRAPLPTLVRLRRADTQIQVSSAELDRDGLLDLALSLVPAPTESPRVLE
jgi:outer membrane lipoprotein-sorting protein